MKPSFKLTNNLRKRLGLVLLLPATLVGAIAIPPHLPDAQAQTTDKRALTVRSDIQEADRETGIVTARGNVQIDYPARQIQATAAQAQYFSRERRLVLSGNAYVLQQGNSLRGETITYLIDEGRFLAMPKGPQQVESIYLVPDSQSPTEPVAPSVNPKPAPKTPVSGSAPRQ